MPIPIDPGFPTEPSRSAGLAITAALAPCHLLGRASVWGGGSVPGRRSRAVALQEAPRPDRSQFSSNPWNLTG